MYVSFSQRLITGFLLLGMLIARGPFDSELDNKKHKKAWHSTDHEEDTVYSMRADTRRQSLALFSLSGEGVWVTSDFFFHSEHVCECPQGAGSIDCEVTGFRQ